MRQTPAKRWLGNLLATALLAVALFAALAKLAPGYGGMETYFVALTVLLPVTRREVFGGSPREMLGSLGVALTLTLCSLCDLGYPIELACGTLPAAARVALCLLFFFVMSRGLVSLFARADRLQNPAPALAENPRGRIGTFALLFGCMLSALAGYWLVTSFPYIAGADSKYQWYMAHGWIGLNDVHAPIHTLLLQLLYSLWDNQTVAVVMNLGLVALTTALLGEYLVWRGQKRSSVAVLCAMCVFAGMSAVYAYPVKDVPYTCLLGVATLLFMRLGDGVRPSVWEAALMGVTLALSFLFRYNGVVLLLLGGGYYAVALVKSGLAKRAAAFALAAVLVVGGVNLYVYRVRGASKEPNGFTYAVFASGIASVVTGGGEITQEELALADELMGLDWMREHYKPWLTRDIIWLPETNDPDGFFDIPANQVWNNFLVVKLGQNGPEVIRLYLRLLPRNLALCLRDLMYNTAAIWRYGAGFNHILCLALWALALLARRGSFTRGRMAAFLPVGLNILSIAVSTITNEERYLLPTFTLFMPLMLYVLGTGKGRKEGE